ncbi:ABC transporter permease [Clostridiisalibacter paucivorans]|uniref:ABC transporter permease n=1 Tax=Clostridiisalibacter paucivorans TaxID=408753 RepID=UPI00047E9022|nr:ABC transporter permease subunit [Clostridiisalibacter paucivorans]
MFWNLVGKEIKYQLKSMTFYAFLIVVILMYMTQFQPPNKYNPLKPIPSNLKESNETIISADKDSIMNSVFYHMEYNINNGVTLKYNTFSKRWVPLSELEKSIMETTKNKIFRDEVDERGNVISLVSYDEFIELTKKLDDKLGRNSIYDIKRLSEEECMDDLILHYGYKDIKDPNEKIDAIYDYMTNILATGRYIEIGIFSSEYEDLSNTQRKAIEIAMERISSNGIDEFDNLNTNIKYNEIERILDDLNNKMGGNTEFAKNERKYIYRKRLSYEDAEKRFGEIINKDKITNAYARYFSDYMGLTAGFYAIFIAAFLFSKRQRQKMDALINRDKTSIKTVILSKYIGVCICILLCYVLVATHATYRFYLISSNFNYTVDLFAFYKYIFIWVLPTVMFTIAIGMLLSIVLNRPILTIIIQGILYGVSVLPLKGDYGLSKFMIRFNVLGYYEDYIKWQPQIIRNRIFYTVLSIGIVIFTIYIWNKRYMKKVVN